MGETATIAQPSSMTLNHSKSPPQKLPLDLTTFPKLSSSQCGHLRHIHNLSSLHDGEWSHMGSQEPGQEWDTAFRYQIATMCYAASSAHFHRLPAMRFMFKGLFARLIEKMLRREVWGYWYLSSQSGVRIDPDLKELRRPWADPVRRENIMYSGHLFLMVSLYKMLFADDRFDQEDGIVLNWDPLFWGMGPEKFSYTRLSLQEVILKEMERENWMGVCCEPNMVFIVCNQFPLIAMRYNDVSDGSNILEDVLPKYTAAWKEKQGFVGVNGLFRRWYSPGQDALYDSDDISHTVWAMAFMPWNYHFVKSLYPSTGHGYLHRIEDRLNLNPPSVANKIRSLVKVEGGNPESEEILKKAKEAVTNQPHSMKKYMSPTFGYLAQWLSEIDGGEDLERLLRHADKYLKPMWERGGLYYSRCDRGWDEDGNFTFVDPYTGNAAIAYARLNIKDGQKKMWDHPWTKEDVEARPWVDEFGFEDGVDCLRGIWDAEGKAMVVSLRTWDGNTSVVKMVVKALPLGEYGVYENGELGRFIEVTSTKQEVDVDIEVDGVGIDVVIVQLRT